MSTICIYHGPGCLDGFASAWTMNKFAKLTGMEVEFVVGIYQTPPPDVTGKDVYLLDFSYKRDVLLEMASKANSITILDHHKTAEEDLKDLPSNVNCTFDMERSGAMITWNHFFPDIFPPMLIKHIEDRDLWKFKIEGTKEVTAALFSYPLDFDIWDDLSNSSESLYYEGIALLRAQEKNVQSLIKNLAYRANISGYNVPIINVPSMFASDVGAIMSIGEPFAASYFELPYARVYSLRSQPGGIDVSVIAKKYGGGGHPGASGFKINFGRIDDI
jgi:oligoribonuclease NrnB/cAMP/cGMP phosphodiesterase (DHH superfamily)